MFLFGHLCGMAVLNGYIQSRSGLTLPEFGLVLSTGAVTALLVNVVLRRSGWKVSGATGLVLLAFAVWLPVLAQGLPALLLAYSMQGAASRIALAGLYRAVTATQRQWTGAGNPTLVLESMAGFGLGESFFLNAVVTQWLGDARWAAGFALGLGIPVGLWLRGKLPDWDAMPTAMVAKVGGGSIAVAFTAYCAEVFTMTQATAWSGVLAKAMRFGSVELPPLVAAGVLSGVFWMVVGSVRYLCGQRETIDLRRVVLVGNVLCLLAVVGAMMSDGAVVLMICYALLGAGIACFVPFALQIISMHPRAGEMADHMALLGPVMSVGVHMVTGNFAGQHHWFVLGALGVALASGLKEKSLPGAR
jgi:hypothetical protein